MNCREFENRWHDLLDARSVAVAEVDATMEAHASACDHCRAVSGRYQLLRLSVGSLAPPPPASAQSIERLRALRVPPARPTIPFGPRLAQIGLAASALAASLLAVAWIGRDRGATAPGVVASPPLVVARPVPPPKAPELGPSLAEAKEATFDLAMELSAPASRIGWEVFDLRRSPGPWIETNTETELDPEPEPKPALVTTGLDLPISGPLRSVGERIEAKVRPIAGPARHAFSFLLDPLQGNEAAKPGPRGSL
jgi:hypothetical protein